MIFVFTGDGKGKTTSAIGQGIRVVGHGNKVLMIQFIKSKEWAAGEDKALRAFGKNFKVIKGGRGFIGIMGDKLPIETHQRAASAALKKAKEAILSKKFDLVILDEINVALSLNLLKIREVLGVVKLSSKKADLILTGRAAPAALVKAADLVTEFKEVKHPFKKGTPGKRRREY